MNLLPDYVALQLAHTSHVTQHFGEDPTNYGFSALELAASWSYGRVYWQIADGLNLNQCVGAMPRMICGSLYGPREIFTAQIGVILFARDR